MEQTTSATTDVDARPAHDPDAPSDVTARPTHEHGRVSGLIAVTIALVSVLGAIVGWRAETHASRAGRYEQDAVATAITAAQVHSDAGTVAARAASEYDHYARLGREADVLRADACNRGLSARDIAALDAGALCSTQAEFAGYANQGYVSGGRFELQRYTADVVAAETLTNDIDARRFIDEADTQHGDEHTMLWLSLLLVVALVWLTIARLQRRTASQLVLAVPGWLCMAGGIVWLLVAEL